MWEIVGAIILNMCLKKALSRTYFISTTKLDQPFYLFEFQREEISGSSKSTKVRIVGEGEGGVSDWRRFNLKKLYQNWSNEKFSENYP